MSDMSATQIAAGEIIVDLDWQDSGKGREP
jgi:hypothetical protein